MSNRHSLTITLNLAFGLYYTWTLGSSILQRQSVQYYRWLIRMSHNELIWDIRMRFTRGREFDIFDRIYLPSIAHLGGVRQEKQEEEEGSHDDSWQWGFTLSPPETVHGKVVAGSLLTSVLGIADTIYTDTGLRRSPPYTPPPPQTVWRLLPIRNNVSMFTSEPDMSAMFD